MIMVTTMISSISGSVRVEPQHGGMSERHIYKYIRECKS
jgi:hypothetical protein